MVLFASCTKALTLENPEDQNVKYPKCMVDNLCALPPTPPKKKRKHAALGIKDGRGGLLLFEKMVKMGRDTESQALCWRWEE